LKSRLFSNSRAAPGALPRRHENQLASEVCEYEAPRRPEIRAEKNPSARAARAAFRAGGPFEFNFCVFFCASARFACDVRRFGSERPGGASGTNGAMVHSRTVLVE